jgi:hypothetical protein
MTLLEGSAPLLWVAPHGGRRDFTRRPWASGSLRVNDLHTAALTAALAAASGGSALINRGHDRNDVDLNRIGETHERARWFLESLAGLLRRTLARYDRATILVVHGWNVIQPVMDLGLGCAPGSEPCAVGSRAAVSPGFAATAVRRLLAACAVEGIEATVGARYPARHRENLLQLFTPRYLADGRPLVRELAALGTRADAVQLELGIPLRWPGPWRERLLAACRAALPALLGVGAEPRAGRGSPAALPPADQDAAGSARPRRLEFASAALSGLVAIDAGRGGRLLLFPPAGGLALFTGERTRPEPHGRLGALALVGRPGGAVRLRFRGPMLRFPDTTPFLDLERGLAAARLAEAEIRLDLVPRHAPAADDPGAGSEFGAVTGLVTLDGARTTVAGCGFTAHGASPAPWPRLRAALHLGEDAALAVTLGLATGAATGFLCRRGRHVPVAGAQATLPAPEAAPARIELDVELADGQRLRVTARVLDRLPVVRAHEPAPLRLDYLSCAVEGAREPAGWCELGGV